MVAALKDFTLYGSRYVHGSPIPEPVWARCNKRVRGVLERNRYITHQPVVAADSPPVSLKTPRSAGGPSPRPRRKAAP